MLDVSNALKNPGQGYAFSLCPESLEMEVLGDQVRFDRIAAEGTFFGTGARVSIEGAVTAAVTSRCAKCLEPVTRSLRAELHLLFARQADPEDPDLYTFEGSKVDLTDAVRDALLLEMPYRFLCSEDCKGLCPICGINLNLGTCTCQEGAIATNPFSALKALVEKDEEV